MNKKTKGAWLLHHAQKLQLVDGAIDFQGIDFSGKCGILLSALAADSQMTLSTKKVNAIAKSANLNVYTDVPTILDKLKEHHLIEKSEHGVDVLGLTTSKVLEHSADIFDSTAPDAKEIAAISLAEETSRAPQVEREIAEWIGDNCNLAANDVDALLDASAMIGFVDVEKMGGDTKLFYNGNLFRVDNAAKVEGVLASLSNEDRRLMVEVEQLLMKKGCVDEPTIKTMLGEKLFAKLHSIGVFDVGIVSNEKETTNYVTRPGAFGKFGSTIAEDALDNAKAFVSSLTYGMTKSIHGRGKIRLLNLLLDKLIAGGTLNPSTAAGQDYKILERRGVVEVRPASGGMFTMRLLKRQVGVLAKKILNFGDASEDSLFLPGASVVNYKGPESTRGMSKKKMAEIDKKAAANLLADIRTGALR